MNFYRTEKNSVGTKKIPYNALYGVFTAQALDTFKISGVKIEDIFWETLAAVKFSAAVANMKLKILNKHIGSAIAKAAREIMQGKHKNQLCMDIFQAGAGTPYNMNMNEVIANRALEILKKKKGSYKIINPNDHINMGQSTNDVIPTATRISVLKKLKELKKNLKEFIYAIKKKETKTRNVFKTARTHLMDAVPIIFSQSISGWRTSLQKILKRITASEKYLEKIPLGGTAAGTGLNAHPKFRKEALLILRKETNLNLKLMSNMFEGLQSAADFIDISNQIKLLAIELNRISNDVRLLSSGPTSGLNEIILPEIEPGSSIMPGKINPSVPECVNQVCYHVVGSMTSVEWASSAGQMELNVMVPIIAYNLIFSIEAISNAIRIFDKKCISGMKVNENICKKYFEDNAIAATALNPILGYAKLAELVKESRKQGKNIFDLIKEKKILTDAELRRHLNPKKLTNS